MQVVMLLHEFTKSPKIKEDCTVGLITKSDRLAGELGMALQVQLRAFVPLFMHCAEQLLDQS
jgi:hypothetical protein